MSVSSHTEHTGQLRQRLEIGTHHLFSDVRSSLGGNDSAPDPHDLFDASLAACKALTVSMYAKRHSMALERIGVDVLRDNSEERHGTYRLTVQLDLIGQLSADEREKLRSIADKCPIHHLMSDCEIIITTQLSHTQHDTSVPTP